VQTEKDVLLVKVLMEGAEGWGECVAGEKPDYSPEYVDGAQDVLMRHMLPRLLDRDLAAGKVAKALACVPGHHMAKAAIEMAVLDAELRARGESFAHFFGAVRKEVDCGVSVGIQPSIPDLLQVVGAFLGHGYRRIELKIKPGRDVEQVPAVRDKYGDVPVNDHAYSAYKLADAQHLPHVHPFALLLLEQPLP